VAYLPEGIEIRAGVQSPTKDILGAMIIKLEALFRLSVVTKPSPSVSNKHISLNKEK
jgi:hypothetical protein